MAGHTCAKKLSSWFFFVALILTQSMFKRTLSKYEGNVNAEGKTLVDIIDCNRGHLQLQITSAKVLVSQPIDSIVCRIKHKRFFKRKINYYSNPRQCGLVVRALVLRSGDPGFKTRSDHSLNLILVVPGSTSQLHL